MLRSQQLLGAVPVMFLDGRGSLAIASLFIFMGLALF